MKEELTTRPEDLSAFLRDVLHHSTKNSVVRIEHVIFRSATEEKTVQRASMLPEALQALIEALRASAFHRPFEAFISAPAVARMLGIKTATLAKWRRQGRGPTGAVRTSPTTVFYPASAVTEFQRTWNKQGSADAADN